MDKDSVKQVLEGKTITSDQLNNLIVDYVKEGIGTDITGDQLAGIRELMARGIFSLRFAASKSAPKLGLNVMNIFDKNNNFLRSYVYDEA